MPPATQSFSSYEVQVFAIPSTRLVSPIFEIHATSTYHSILLRKLGLASLQNYKIKTYGVLQSLYLYTAVT